MLRMMVALMVALVSLTACEGQTETRVFVTNSAGRITVAYNACRGRGEIRELRLSDEPSNGPSRTLWEVVLARGAGVDRIALGAAPSQYRVVSPYQDGAAKRSKHLAVDITGVDGYSGGLAGDFMHLGDGALLWSEGVRHGTSIADVKKESFGC